MTSDARAFLRADSINAEELGFPANSLWRFSKFIEFEPIDPTEVGITSSSPSLVSIHYGWRRHPLRCCKWVLLWMRRPKRERHCLPQSGHWWRKSGIGQSTGACGCLRLRMGAAARSYESLKYDIAEALMDFQVALLDARVSILLKGMFQFSSFDLMWTLMRFFVHQHSCGVVLVAVRHAMGQSAVRHSDDVVQPAEMELEEHGFDWWNPSPRSNFRMCHFVPPTKTKK